MSEQDSGMGAGRGAVDAGVGEASAGGGTPPTERGEFRQIDQPAWPTAVGVISIVLGSLGAMSNLWGVVAPFLMGVFEEMARAGGAEMPEMWSGGMKVAMALVALVALGLSVWLLASGIGVVRRRRWGVSSLRGWAWARIVLGLVQAGVTGALQYQQFLAMQESTASSGGGGAGMFSVMGPVMAAIGAGWTLLVAWAWPVFCLIWLGRKRVRAHYGKWA